MARLQPADRTSTVKLAKTEKQGNLMSPLTTAAVKGLRVLDPLVAVGLIAPAAVMRLARRVKLQKLPITQRTLLAIGVLPLYNHYHDPQFRPNGLTRDHLLRDRPLPGIDLRLPAQRELLKGFRFQAEMADVARGRPPKGGAYWFDNPYFQRMDGSMWYSVLRTLKPRTVLEVGSGFSTLIARRALARNEVEGGGRARHVCIEPYENPWLECCGAEIIREPVEQVDHSLFESLLAGDILFIDSSHVTRPGGDVVVEILNVLPRLARGVITHFHDIFTPKDYPWDWLFKEPRMWNEQYMLALNPCFEVMLSLQHLWHAAPADLEAACVPLDGQPLVAPSTSEGVQ